MPWEQLSFEVGEMFENYSWRQDEIEEATWFAVSAFLMRRREYWRERAQMSRMRKRLERGLPPPKKYAKELTAEEKLQRRREKQRARWARRRAAAGFAPPKKYRRGVTVEQRREENRLRRAAWRERVRQQRMAA